MYEEKQQVKIFRVTVKKVLQRLSLVKDCEVSNFKDFVVEQFDGYDYEGEEELIGFDSWGDLSQNGKYELNVKINHEGAYEFTLFVEVNDKKATVYNVL
ncbi:MAG: hypothetical protein U9R39_11080 [Campylobacterota bacterium]|nr:hypothetical protein [Campylobacterota bacterium]